MTVNGTPDVSAGPKWMLVRANGLNLARVSDEGTIEILVPDDVLGQLWTTSDTMARIFAALLSALRSQQDQIKRGSSIILPAGAKGH